MHICVASCLLCLFQRCKNFDRCRMRDEHRHTHKNAQTHTQMSSGSKGRQDLMPRSRHKSSLLNRYISIQTHTHKQTHTLKCPQDSRGSRRSTADARAARGAGRLPTRLDASARRCEWFVLLALFSAPWNSHVSISSLTLLLSCTPRMPFHVNTQINTSTARSKCTLTLTICYFYRGWGRVGRALACLFL